MSVDAPTLTIIVTGSRLWTDDCTIKTELRRAICEYNSAGWPVRVVHGNARGADTYADTVVRLNGHLSVPYSADWNVHGHAAGQIRNQRMLDGHRDAVVCLAFTDDPPAKKGSGTWDMVTRCLSAGMPVRVFTSKDRR